MIGISLDREIAPPLDENFKEKCYMLWGAWNLVFLSSPCLVIWMKERFSIWYCIWLVFQSPGLNFEEIIEVKNGFRKI